MQVFPCLVCECACVCKCVSWEFNSSYAKKHFTSIEPIFVAPTAASAINPSFHKPSSTTWSHKNCKGNYKSIKEQRKNCMLTHIYPRKDGKTKHSKASWHIDILNYLTLGELLNNRMIWQYRRRPDISKKCEVLFVMCHHVKFHLYALHHSIQNI